jgi:hypothetical protein
VRGHLQESTTTWGDDKCSYSMTTVDVKYDENGDLILNDALIEALGFAKEELKQSEEFRGNNPLVGKYKSRERRHPPPPQQAAGSSSSTAGTCVAFPANAMIFMTATLMMG